VSGKGLKSRGYSPFCVYCRGIFLTLSFHQQLIVLTLGPNHLFQLTTCQASVEKLITAKRKRVLWLIAFFKCGQVLQLFIAQAKDKPQFNDE